MALRKIIDVFVHIRDVLQGRFHDVKKLVESNQVLNGQRKYVASMLFSLTNQADAHICHLKELPFLDDADKELLQRLFTDFKWELTESHLKEELQAKDEEIKKITEKMKEHKKVIKDMVAQRKKEDALRKQRISRSASLFVPLIVKAQLSNHEKSIRCIVFNDSYPSYDQLHKQVLWF